MQIRAAVCRAPDVPVAIEDVDLDEPRDDEVLVRLVASGVCHTDLGAPHFCALPAVFGHEGAGIVEGVGARVGKVRRGDRVVLTFGSCGACRHCHEGVPSHCSHMTPLQFGGSRLDGSPTMRGSDGPVRGAFFQQSSFATYALATERNVVRVPDEMPLELAAPLGCGVQTGVGAILNTLRAPAGSSVAIFGVGSVGLAAVMGARFAGCRPIIAIDVLPERLELAREFGATHALDGRDPEIVARVRAVAREGVDFSLDTAGNVTTLDSALKVLANRGHCAFFTVPDRGAPIPVSLVSLLVGGKSLTGVLEGSSVPDVFIPRLIDWHLAGLLPVDRLVRDYPFADIARALDDAAHGRAIKPVLRMA
jgi:aryl-alcohol dehydrogenase